MENNKENRLGMFQKVHGYLLAHTTETAAIAAVATQLALLDTHITNIFTYAAIADADPTGAAVAKQNKRNALRKTLLKVSTGLMGLAAMTDDAKMIEKVDETIASMDAMRDNDFYTYSQTVLNVSSQTGVAAALAADWDVDAADITALGTAAAAYLILIQDPKLERVEQTVARTRMDEEFELANNMLTNKLDKVMTVFAATNSGLYAGYKSARSIDDTGAITDPDFEGIAPHTTITELTNIPYSSGRNFRIRNIGDVPLTFALTTTPTTLEGLPAVVLPGGYNVRSSNTLNADNAANLLVVQNNDGTDGKYKIWIDE